MSGESSRKEVPVIPETGGCPRCGVRLRESFKYCPNCAYRLRPGLFEAAPRSAPRPPLAHRLVALGGYLAFASMLLLVVFAGFRLFVQPEIETAPVLVTYTRDPGCVVLGFPGSFQDIDHGFAYVGRFDDRVDEPVVPRTFQVDDYFKLCIHEISNDQYYEFLLAWAAKAGGPVPVRLYPDAWSRRTGNPDVIRIYDRHTGNLPVTGVPFRAAREFCAWFWEAHLGADPDWIVDLPTALDYVRAARGDDPYANFPERESGDETSRLPAVLDGELAAIDEERTGCDDRGIHALVGNASEWAYGLDGWPTAVGGSHLDHRWLDEPGHSPFQEEDWEVWREGAGRPYVGFRILLRPAPSLPSFVRVNAGTAQCVLPGPPGRVRLWGPVLVSSVPVVPEVPESDDNGSGEDSWQRPAGADVEPGPREVVRPFEMSSAEITNRQYLTFLASLARTSPDEVGALVPVIWDANLKAGAEATFPGPYGGLTVPYAPGHENRPVEGVGLEAVRAYTAWLAHRLGRRCRMPTLGEFLRAAREGGTEPYGNLGGPWDPLLVCRREGDEPRPASLLGRADLLPLSPDAPPPRALLAGLAGNVAEYVVDERSGRVLLAGGHYRFPAETCTLDTLVDVAWDYVEYNFEEEGELLTETIHKGTPQSPSVWPMAGFRVVREVRLP